MAENISISNETTEIATDNAEDVSTSEAIHKLNQSIKQSSEKEKDLLDVVFTLESEKQALVEESKKRIGHLRKDLEDSLTENEKLKRKIHQLEQSLKQSVALGGGDAPKSREEQEELLVRAKTLLFEKTKVNKQQEQHISSLKNQVESIKAVLDVTKDMLNLKNTELEHMQARLDKSVLWIKAEKDRATIFEKKLVISQGVYDKLRSEYDIQSSIFKNLKEAYESKIKVLSGALETAKKN